jgi:hypothetical protein
MLSVVVDLLRVFRIANRSNPTLSTTRLLPMPRCIAANVTLLLTGASVGTAPVAISVVAGAPVAWRRGRFIQPSYR